MAMAGLLTFGWLAGAMPVLAQDSFELRTQKLHSRSGDSPGNLFGNAVALSDRFILVGEHYAENVGPFSGAAWVFHARTGRLLQRLKPAELMSTERYGASVAVSGHLGLVGSPNSPGEVIGAGAAFLYDLRNGRLIRRLQAPAAFPTTEFGASVVINPDYLVVGDPYADTLAGRVFVFSTQTGEFLATLTASDRAINDSFGTSLALCGRWLAVGAILANGLVANTGAVYVYDLSQPGAARTEERKFIPPAAETEMNFGQSVALDGNFLLVGAPHKDSASANSGAAYLYRVTDALAFETLTPSNPVVSLQFGQAVALGANGHLALVGSQKSSVTDTIYRFDDIGHLTSTVVEDVRIQMPDKTAEGLAGSALALCGNQAVLGAQGDRDRGVDAGAAYSVRDLVGVSQLVSKAQRGSFAPGTIDADFASFLPPAINYQGKVAFSARVAGPGASGGRQMGIWSDLAPSPNVVSLIRMGDDFGSGGRVTSVGDVILNNANAGLVECTQRGPAFNASNNRFLWATEPGGPVEILRTGPSLVLGGGESFAGFLQYVQAQVDRIGVAYRLRPGTGGTTPASDTGVLLMDHAGGTLESSAREGNVIAGATWGGDRFGQFFGRVGIAPTTSEVIYGFFRLPMAGGPPVPQLASDQSGFNPEDIAARGDFAPDLALGETFRSFLGESIDRSLFGAFRATLHGTGVNAGNNEGIWRSGIVTRKGNEPDPAGEPGVRFTRFLGVWQTDQQRILFLAKLRGPGVTPANDCGLYMKVVSEAGIQCLVREGEPICGSDSAGGR